MAHAGPWLVISGGMITSDWIVQRWKDYFWVPVHSTLNDGQCVRIGRVLYALRESLAQLDTWYNTVPCVPSTRRFFPYPRQFEKDGTLFEFDYQSPLETDAACKTYLATLQKDSTQVVVKFVETYGEEAHNAMADVGFAPILLYCGSIQPGDLHNLKMVVMEYVSTRHPAHMQGAPELQQLPEIIKTLHAKGFVFGDLRLPNIVITDE